MYVRGRPGERLSPLPSPLIFPPNVYPGSTGILPGLHRLATYASKLMVQGVGAGSLGYGGTGFQPVGTLRSQPYSVKTSPLKNRRSR